MRILHILREKSSGQIGGVENHVKYLTLEQKRQGLEPVVLTFMLSDKYNLEIKNKEGIDWYYLQIKRRYTKLKWPKFLTINRFEIFKNYTERIIHNFFIESKTQLISKINPDIIHQHDYLSSVRLSIKLAKKFNLIFTNHYGEYLFLNKTRLTRIFQNYFLSHYKCIIAPSYNLLPLKENCYFIPNGFDNKLFNKVSSKKKQALKNDYNFHEKIVFLCARRWAPNKGVIYFAKAINLLTENVKQKCVFLFAGNDSEDYELYKQEILKELNKNITAEIHLYGNLNHNDLSTLIAASDIGVIPSLVEGLSLYSLELISCGVPVLATNVGGLPQIIKTNETGWLVPPKSAESLANEITRIVNDWPGTNITIDTMDFNEKYSWESVAKETLKIYKQYI